MPSADYDIRAAHSEKGNRDTKYLAPFNIKTHPFGLLSPRKKCQVPPVGLAAVNKVTDFSAPVNTFLFFLSEIFLNFTVGPLLGDPKKSFLTSTVRRRNKWAGRPFASAPSTKPPNFDLLRREGAKHPQADGWHFESFTATETPRSGEVRLRASSISSSPPCENIKKIALMTPLAQVHYGHPLRPPPLFF